MGCLPKISCTVLARASPPKYRVCFSTSYRNAARSCRFNPTGTILAIGSADTAVKLLDVERMKNWDSHSDSDDRPVTSVEAQPHPVICTYYEHTQPINDIDFNPCTPHMLATCARDCTIRLFDLRNNSKRCFHVLKDSQNVRSLCYHPAGEYLLSGDAFGRCSIAGFIMFHHLDISFSISLYDLLHQYECYCTRAPQDNHRGPVNQVRYFLDGSMYVSCSKDGSVKLWDGKGAFCVRTISDAHSGREVCSALFSKNGKYILTSGKDATVRLWEIGTGRQLLCVCVSSAAQKYRLQACFSFGEEYFLACDEHGNCARGFESRTGEELFCLKDHTAVIRWVSSSPKEDLFVTCSMDGHARLWTSKEKT